jgi:polar amino acid transport system substrate-binding protein
MSKHLIKIVILCIVVVIGVTGLYWYLNSDGGAENDLIAQHDVTYRIGLDDADYPPLLVYGEGMEATGFDPDLIHWIADEMKFNVIFVPMPWDNIFAALDAKEIDMMMSGVSITPERMENYLFSDPYLSISQSVAIGERGTMFMDDFYAGHGIVGVQAGTTSEDLVTEILIDSGILPEEKLKTYAEIEVGAQDLASGNIQYLLSDWPVMVALVQTHPIHIIGNVDTGEKYGIALHKDNKELQQIINLGLEQLTTSYEWDAMKNKYLLDY